MEWSNTDMDHVKDDIVDNRYYADAANALRVTLEDAHSNTVTKDLAREALYRALYNRTWAAEQHDPEDIEFVEDMVRDDATFIIEFEETLRPILEALWRNNG